ncbi:hypothetical protein ACJWDR_27400 [Streptomyces tauricus]|uniref:hypothetical protein n=1 Tax=Streptomyces tauricus TaxID=68274 RepID=UPI00387F2FF0
MDIPRMGIPEQLADRMSMAEQHEYLHGGSGPLHGRPPGPLHRVSCSRAAGGGRRAAGGGCAGAGR